jgi:hypothetical protein
MLVTLVCILVLSVILLNALRGAVGGPGVPGRNTVRSVEDQLKLYAMSQAMAVWANDHDGWYPVPHQIAGTDDRTLDTTAAFYSAMVMHLRIAPEQLISAGEVNGWVEIDDDYDHTAYDPASGVFWDAGFEGNLERGSNVSFAHLPMFGERHERGWRHHRSAARLPLLGRRGPRDGVPDPDSFTCDPTTGAWAGHLAFADAHVEFVDSFTPIRADDNIFAMEEGPGGGDAILAFTVRMDPVAGPVLQFD